MLEVNPSIFREYDIRGEYPTALNEQSAELIGKAFGSEVRLAGQDSCYLAWDGRHSSPALKAAFSQGVLSTGCNIIEIGAAPTAVAFWIIKEQAQSCAIITGSHNPKQDNGIKMAVAGKARSGEDIQVLLSRIQLNLFKEGDGSVSQAPDAITQYGQKSLEGLKLDHPVKVVLDAGNGIGGPLALSLFEQLGCEVIPMACEVDGDFPLHHPDPAKLKNLQHMREAVLAEKADLGIALDGDADRIGVIDNQGNAILPDRLSLLFVQNILDRQPGATCLYDVKCTELLPRFIKQWGGSGRMIATGHSTMKKAIKETNAAFATELSGHILFNDEHGLGVDDGIYAGLRLLALLGQSELSLSQLMAQYPEPVSTPEIQIAVDEKAKFHTMKIISADGFRDYTVQTVDGLRILFDEPEGQGWALVRASNTTPCLTVRFEADNQPTLSKIQDQVRAELARLMPDLTLGF